MGLFPGICVNPTRQQAGGLPATATRSADAEPVPDAGPMDMARARPMSILLSTSTSSLNVNNLVSFVNAIGNRDACLHVTYAKAGHACTYAKAGHVCKSHHVHLVPTIELSFRPPAKAPSGVQMPIVALSGQLPVPPSPASYMHVRETDLQVCVVPLLHMHN